MVDEVNVFHNEEGQWEVEFFDRARQFSLEHVSVDFSAQGGKGSSSELVITIKGAIKR